MEMLKANKFVLFEDDFLRSIISDFFEAYNFTVDENSPNDQEVSIDPEMLGKVFENTLAEEDRGKKGTFYTPREVVHFMVKESLLQYLKNETSIDPETLHDFIFNETFDLEKFSKAEVRLIDQKLEGVKVLDPAVGSAAFPVEMMQVLIALRKQLDVKVGKNVSEVALRKSFIKNNLYGVDIDSSAIEIAKLRLWLSLIVDYDRSEVEPLPNLDFQFRVGNSLQEKIDDFDIFNESNMGPQGVLFKDASEYEKLKDRMLIIKNKFYLSRYENEKRELKREFDELEHHLIQAVLTKYRNELDSQLRNQRIGNVAVEIQGTIDKINRLEQRIKDGTYKLFKPDFHFSEVFDRKDETGKMIGGFDIVIGNPPYGVAVEEEIKVWHGLVSKDSYGVFISTALKRFLKPGGVLSYIVSDTWLTIKSHKPLRVQVLNNELHKVIRMHQDCFDATVNACIMILSKKKPKESNLLIGDLSNLSTRSNIEEFRTKLYCLDKYVGCQDEKIAIYRYPQRRIFEYKYLPIFVGSLKIFEKRNACKTTLGNCIEEICGGIKSYNDKKYVRNIYGNMGYRTIDSKNIVNRELSQQEKNNGIEIHNSEHDRYFIRCEKGGETRNPNGSLNFYYKPVEFYFPWDKKTVKEVGSNNGLRNRHRYFSQGIGVSTVGIYAPIFRYCEFDVFFNNYNIIFPKDLKDTFYLLPVLCSKSFRYLLDVYENHSVAKNQVDLLEVPIPDNYRSLEKIERLCKQIIEKLRVDPDYDYVNNEQLEIESLIYLAYGFSAEDIQEIETWYIRRYPNLVR